MTEFLFPRERLLLLVLCVLLLGATLSCGLGGGSGSGSGSGSSSGTLQGPAVTTAGSLDSVTDPQALAFLVLGTAAGNCYPGGTVTFSAYETYISDAVHGTIAKPVSPSALSWSSSNTSVATVNSTGVVTCIANGMAQINITEPNASTPFTAIVFVGAVKSVLRLTPATGTFHVGDSVTFNVILDTERPDGSVTSQDVSSSVSISTADSLSGTGNQVLTLAATSASTNNQFKAAHAGTAWGVASYHVPNPDFAYSNVFTISVQ